MSVLNDTWRFLVQRRLWPVAILLIAAAAAVPMLLSEQPAPPPATPQAALKADKQAVLATDPIVVPAADGDRAGRRRVLGSRKDPFKPQATPTPTPKPETASTEKPADIGAAPTTGDGGDASVGGSPAPASGTPVVPEATPEKKTYELHELTVRFGASEGESLPRRDVRRLQALPSAEDPVLIYLGVLKDNKTAVFMLDSGVVAQGDGECKPSRAACETIHIREGETEFFDVGGEEGETGGAQYQLDVIKIRKKTTTNARQAKAAKARVSTKGRRILRARIAGDGPLRYRYDQKSGQLEKLSKKAYKAVVAKAAKAAMASF
jgi:hypothetical protein